MKLNKVFQEAREYNANLKLQGTWDGIEEIIAMGVKIEKHPNGQINMLNTMSRKGYYDALSDEQVKYFSKKGWKCGLHYVNLQHNEQRIVELQSLIEKSNNQTLIGRWTDTILKLKLANQKHEILCKKKN
jgi:environmental stress-induced protein Ves|tara:strand:- start:2884 stop:3273 length:390 start_codon:yes stop_codon:yes gene_type:complete